MEGQNFLGKILTQLKDEIITMKKYHITLSDDARLPSVVRQVLLDVVSKQKKNEKKSNSIYFGNYMALFLWAKK